MSISEKKASAEYAPSDSREVYSGAFLLFANSLRLLYYVRKKDRQKLINISLHIFIVIY